MKTHTPTIALAVFVALTFAQGTLAQDISPSYGPINFGMLGITRRQTLNLNVVAVPPSPCVARLGFQDSSGKPVGSTLAVTLDAGQSASLALKADSLASEFIDRVELLPTVAAAWLTESPNYCAATAEVIDNDSGATVALVIGASSWPAQPFFGMAGVTLLQTVRLNVVAFPPNPCIAQISFADKGGNPIGEPMAVDLMPGQATFLDLHGRNLVKGLGQRAEIRPIITLAAGVPSACIGSGEVYNDLSGRTEIPLPTW